MNRDDVIRMAREAGVVLIHDRFLTASAERFAALVAAHERVAKPGQEPIRCWGVAYSIGGTIITQYKHACDATSEVQRVGGSAHVVPLYAVLVQTA